MQAVVARYINIFIKLVLELPKSRSVHATQKLYSQHVYERQLL